MGAWLLDCAVHACPFTAKPKEELQQRGPSSSGMSGKSLILALCAIAGAGDPVRDRTHIRSYRHRLHCHFQISALSALLRRRRMLNLPMQGDACVCYRKGGSLQVVMMSARYDHVCLEGVPPNATDTEREAALLRVRHAAAAPPPPPPFPGGFALS